MSEIAVTIAITQAGGWIQALLAIFAVVFPTLVAAVFFYILWHDNKVLYAPRDFAEGTTVTEYAEAMSRTARRSVNIVESALRGERNRLAAQLTKLGVTEAERDEILASVGDAARRTVITVDISVFEPGATTIDIPVDENSAVAELLDAVYFAISDRVSSYSYRRTWLLRDEATGQLYDEIGTYYARRHLQADRDFRLLTEVGIGPGASLTVVPVLAPRDLDAREVQLLQLVADGKSNKEIGEGLNLSVLTVKAHLSRIGGKLGTGDRATMVALAMRSGVIR
jgi:DNA-binding CsgD family transcriptional regulator